MHGTMGGHGHLGAYGGPCSGRGPHPGSTGTTNRTAATHATITPRVKSLKSLKNAADLRHQLDTTKIASKTFKNVQHPAFPRGPPPQYYLDSNLLNFAVRMGRVTQVDMAAHDRVMSQKIIYSFA